MITQAAKQTNDSLLGLPTYAPALLALENGSVFWGSAVGAFGETEGELVFNTALTGYQEILTDPSYAQQMVIFTNPHIGNVGTNPEDIESDRVWASAAIMRDLPQITSNWRATESLTSYFQKNNLIVIADIDTRCLTRLIRRDGALRGCIIAGTEALTPAAHSNKALNHRNRSGRLNDDTLCEIEKNAIAKARACPGLENLDLAKIVSTTTPYEWKSPPNTDASNPRYNIVVYDFGVKYNILRLLAQHHCRVTVVPAQTPAEAVLAMNPDGVLLSNGPGDPHACDYAIHAIQRLLKERIPLLGICLGYQLLALACNAKTYKMKFGHHGANHPVQEIHSKRVLISSQNHGFAVDATSLPDTLKPTHRSLFDASLQGIQHTTLPAFGFQGHPEASPGPHDIVNLFKQFTASCKSRITSAT